MTNKIIETIWDSDTQSLEKILASGGNPNVQEDGISALMWACSILNLDMVNILINYGADVNFKAIDGETPLIRASYVGFAQAVGALLKAGATVDDADEIGQTAFMAAAKSGRLEVMKLLIQYAARHYLKDKRGSTVLHWAATEGDYPEVATYLLTLGLDPTENNLMGKSPLDYAKDLKREKMLVVMLGREKR